MDIIFNNWKGIAQSPFEGNGDARNVDINNYPGSLRLSKRLQQSAGVTLTPKTFTAESANETITFASLALTAGREVYVSSTGTLPTGLYINTVYYVCSSGLTSTTCKLSTTYADAIAGTAINLETDGVGTHTITPVNMGLVTHIVTDPRTGYHYALDTNGRIWVYTSRWALITGNTLTNASGNGLVLWKDHLIVFRNAKVDVYGALSSSPSWTNDWKTLTTAAGVDNSHHAIIGTDDMVYFADSNYVGSLQENTGQTFTPGTSGTFTFNLTALTLPTYWIVKRIEQFGKNLQVIANRSNTYETKVFPWDRASTSFNLPISIPLSSVLSSAQDANWTYISGGGQGTIFRTNNTTTEEYVKFPEYLSGVVTGNNLLISALAISDNKLLFAVNYPGVSGVWSKNLDNGQIKMDSKFSASGYGTNNGISCKTLYPILNSVFAPWYDPDNSLYGVDSYYVDSFKYHTAYSGYLETDLRRLGTHIQKVKPTQIEFILSKPLVAGQGVQAQWRTAVGETYSSAIVFDSSISTIETTFHFPLPIPKTANVQLKISLTCSDGSVTNYQSPELLEVRLR